MILNRTLGDPRRVLYGAAALLLLLEVGGLIVQRTWAREQFVALALLHAAVYLGAVLVLQHRRGPCVGLAFILIVTALLRVGPLVGPVIWSSDIYRYIWDGWVQSQGINPYCCLPSDPALVGLRDDEIYPLINRKDTARTIYPPVAQMVFAAHGWLGGTLFSMKALLLAFEALGIWAMLRLLARLGRPRQEILIYGWHPLPVWEIAGSGHFDALLVAFVPLALLGALSGRRLLSGIALGAAVLTKFIPIVLFPAVWRRWDWRMPLAGAVFMAVCYLPYLGVGARVLGYLPDYVEEEHIGPGLGTGFWLVDTLHQLFGVALPSTAYLGLSAVILLMMGLFAIARAAGDRAALRWAMTIGLTTMLLFSPHYAWYFVWVIVLLTLSPWTPGLWPTLTAFLLYWDPIGGRVPTWVGAIIYGGFAVLAIVWLVRAGLHAGEHGAASHSHQSSRPGRHTPNLP